MVTIVYFKNLNNTTQHTSQVMRTIPDDASIIFEFNNEKGFYDIFSGNNLFTTIAGEKKLAELAALRKQLLQNPLVEQYLNGQNIFISLHAQKGNDIDFLLTTSVAKGFQSDLLDQLAKQPKSGMLITNISLGGREGYTIYLNDLKKRFYLIEKDNHILSGSFSKDLVDASARYDYKKENQSFVLMSDRQSSNSLANLYVNYKALSPLFGQLFINKNTDLLKNFRQLPAFAALSLNYKSDALMFNGSTQIKNDQEDSYLNLFMYQQPVINHLKDIFPSTTAYSTNFAVSDPIRFESDLSDSQTKGGFKTERSSIFTKIKKETGAALKTEFTKLLSNEFAVVTTRYREKIGIIEVKDGSKLQTLMVNISKVNNDGTAQFNYDKLPQLLLGDAFSVFKKPYYRVMDNYLVLTNSLSELASYNDSYINRKFLSKMDEYNRFNELLAEKSNVTFFIQFKNALALFKQDMKPAFYDAFENNSPGWKDFYGASWQFASSEKNYYTNFCIRLSNDTASLKSSL